MTNPINGQIQTLFEELACCEESKKPQQVEHLFKLIQSSFTADLETQDRKQFRKYLAALQDSSEAQGNRELTKKITDYIKTIYPPQASESLVDISASPRDLLIHNAPNQEQKDLLAYVSDEKLCEILTSFDHPRQTELINLLKAGNWTQFIGAYQIDKTLPIHNILLAAFCQERISIDDLATAFIFLAPAGDGRYFSIEPFQVASSQEANWPDIKKRWTKESIELIPPHLRFFIVVYAYEMGETERALANAFFDNLNRWNFVTGGICSLSKTTFGMGSTALLKAEASAIKHPPVFVLGLTPSRLSMYDHLLEGRSDFALIEPKTDCLIHSVKSASLLPYIHDGYHLDQRSGTSMLERTSFLELGQTLQRLLDTKIPDYSNPAIVIRDLGFYPSLSIDAAREDLARFLLDEISSLIVDGETSYDLSRSDIELLQALCDKIVGQVSRHFSYDAIKMAIPVLNLYVEEMDIRFSMTPPSLQLTISKIEKAGCAIS